MPSSYFFFRPLVSPIHGWVAFDFDAGTDANADIQEYQRQLKASDAGALASLHPLVIRTTPDWIAQETLVNALEPQQSIFLLPSEAIDNAATLDRCKKLIDHGHHLGIQISDREVLRKIPLASFDHIGLSAAFAHDTLTGFDLAYLGNAGFRKIATDVNTHEIYDWLATKNFDLCQSAFMATRRATKGRQPDLARLKLLKLLSIVERDGDTREIEAIFREEPKLSYNLLRLVNSVAVGARTRISNFSQAIAILGRRQLQRWLQLLIYANNLTEGNTPNPLMQLAAARGRLVELLCKSIDPPPGNQELCDNAFMTGLFSLLDVLINLPMADILTELPLHDEVTLALNSQASGGMLGKLLSIVAAGEASDFALAEHLLDELNISPETHAAAQVSALLWASRINIDKE